jgi:hypothetical protein
MARQTDTDTSPAALFLNGNMHEIVLDGTFDGESPFSITLSTQMPLDAILSLHSVNHKTCDRCTPRYSDFWCPLGDNLATSSRRAVNNNSHMPQ